MPQQTVAVVFGGRSVEHEVSVISAHQVMDALEVAGFGLLPVFIDKNGAWFAGKGLYDLKAYAVSGFQPDSLRDVHRVSLCPDTSVRQLVLHPHGAKGFFYKPPILWADVFFPMLHGTFGEDGRMQSLFELADVPYVGAGVEASSIGMDKIRQKELYRQAGLPVLDCVWSNRAAWRGDADGFTARVEAKLSYPVMVKPSSLGSSIGVARCRDAGELARSLELAFQFDERVMVEPALVNFKEVNCSVIGPPYRTSVCEMPTGDGELLSFDDKYRSGGKKSGGASKSGMASLNRQIPAPIGDELTARAKDLALGAYQAIGCEGIARIDCLLDGENLYVNEINTLPGSLSFYLWEASGLPFDQLVGTLVKAAVARHAERARTQFSLDVNLLSAKPA